jgi:hypothetical protein
VLVSVIVTAKATSVRVRSLASLVILQDSDRSKPRYAASGKGRSFLKGHASALNQARIMRDQAAHIITFPQLIEGFIR